MDGRSKVQEMKLKKESIRNRMDFEDDTENTCKISRRNINGENIECKLKQASQLSSLSERRTNREIIVETVKS